MKRRVIQIFILPLLFCLAYFISDGVLTARAEPESGKLRIGFILPLSGEWARLGKGLQNSALLALEDLGQLPEEKQPGLYFEDNQGSLESSAKIAAQLIEDKHVNAIVSIISGVAQVIRPIASRKGVISIGICSDTSAADGRFAFINYLTAEQGAAEYLRYLRQKDPADPSFTILHLNEAGFSKIAGELQLKAPSSKVRIAGVESFNQGTADFRSVLLRISRQHPGTVNLLALSPEAELIARQSKELNLGLKFSSIETFGLIQNPALFEGSWFVDAAYPSKEFVARYRTQFGSEISAGVGHAHDTVMLLAEAFKAPDPVAAFRALANFQGVIGKLTVRPDGIIWSGTSVKVIKDGRPVAIEGDSPSQ